MEKLQDFDEFVFENAKTDLVEEGLMAQIDVLVQDTKSVEEFIKKFFKEYGDKIKKNPKSVEWASELYNDSASKNEATKLDEKKPQLK